MAEARLEGHLRPVPPTTPTEPTIFLSSKLLSSPSQASIQTSSTFLTEEGEEDAPSPYILRNLITGQTLDLREECKPGFSARYAQVTSATLNEALTLW